MSEIIPTGAQGKAIYGEGNYIIDGPAGTGKSTTALQKIKLLQLNEKIDASKICVVVKNNKVVPNFIGLLNSIEVENVNVLSANEFLKKQYDSIDSIKQTQLSKIHNDVEALVKKFKKAANINTLISITLESEEQEQSEPLKELLGSERFDKLSMQLLALAKTYRDKKRADDKSYTQSIKQLHKRSKDYEKERENKPEYKKELANENGLYYLETKRIIKEEVDDFKSIRKKPINEMIRVSIEELETQLNKIKSLHVSLNNEFFSKNNLSCVFGNDNVISLVELYANKHSDIKDNFHTIIIDEAQDVPAKVIELIRLHCENLVLVGDESQKENPKGVGPWENLLLKESVYSNVDGLNIYHLRHNFRQTYELGTVSYNYRQLMLGRNIHDIKEDYFVDQIGFNRPEVQLITENSEFLNLVIDKLNYIKESFSKPFPLVIFYNDVHELTDLKNLLVNSGHTVDVDNPSDEKLEVLLISVNEIAGREFPVVIAPLCNSQSNPTIYIMLSRAKFDLTLFVKPSYKINYEIKQLIDYGLLTTKGELKNDIEALSRQVTENYVRSSEDEQSNIGESSEFMEAEKPFEESEDSFSNLTTKPEAYDQTILSMSQWAVDDNNTDAIYVIADFLLQKETITFSTVQAIDLLEKAVALGSKQAMCRLAQLYKTQKKDIEAFELFVKSIEYGAEESALSALELYLEFNSTQKISVQSEMKALIKCIDASKQPKVLNMLAKMYLHGNAIDVDKAESLRLFKKSAELEDEYSLYCIGQIYYSGEGISINKEKAAEYFHRAAEKLHRDSLYCLAKMYKDGDGVEQNIEKAKLFHQRAF